MCRALAFSDNWWHQRTKAARRACSGRCCSACSASVVLRWHFLHAGGWVQEAACVRWAQCVQRRSPRASDGRLWPRWRQTACRSHHSRYKNGSGTHRLRRVASPATHILRWGGFSCAPGECCESALPSSILKTIHRRATLDMDWTRRCPQRRSGATSRTKVVGCVERTADSERHADGALVYRFEITLYRSSLAGVRVWTVVCGPCFSHTCTGPPPSR